MPITKTTIGRQDTSLVNARQFGTPRTHVTIQLALDAIGSLHRTLNLTDEDDGIWTLGGNITIPANVMLQIPAGVTIVGTGNLTILGGLMAFRWPVYTGSGVFTWTGGGKHNVFNKLTVDALTVRNLTVENRGTVGQTFHIGTLPEDVPPWPGAPLEDPITRDVNASSINQTTTGGAVSHAAAWESSQYTLLSANTLPDSVHHGTVAATFLNTQTFHFIGDIRGIFAFAMTHGSGTLDAINCVYAAAYPVDPSTTTFLTCYAAFGPAVGTTGVVANYRGLTVYDLETARTTTSAYAVHSMMSSGAGRYGLYMQGDAPNYLVGNVGIGAGATAPPHPLYVIGRATLGAPNSAPTDGDILPGQISFYLNQAGNNLLIRVRYSDNTLKLATIALT